MYIYCGIISYHVCILLLRDVRLKMCKVVEAKKEGRWGGMSEYEVKLQGASS